MTSSSHIFLGSFLESQVMRVQGRFTCIYSNLVPGNGIGEVSMHRVVIFGGGVCGFSATHPLSSELSVCL